MPFCPNCGFQHEGLKFCPECGQAQNASATASAPVQPQTSPAAFQDEAEQTVWEGESKDLANLASGGRVKRARYRITNRMIYFEEGVLSTNAEQVPLWAVRDIDLKQSMTQKVRGVGNVIVHVEHSDYTGRKELVLENIEQSSKVRDILNQSAQRERLAYEQRKQTRFYRQ